MDKLVEKLLLKPDKVYFSRRFEKKKTISHYQGALKLFTKQNK